MKEIEVKKDMVGQSLGKMVKRYLADAPLSFIYRLFRKKDIKVDNHWAKFDKTLKEGEVVRIYVSDEQIVSFVKKEKEEAESNLFYPIAYEDRDILIVDKPRGVLVEMDKDANLTYFVRKYLKEKGEYISGDGAYDPSPVHRLDRNTGGLVIFAKNVKTAQFFYEALKDRKYVEKTYLALSFIDKKVPDSGVISLPLFKDAKNNIVRIDKDSPYAKEAITEYSIIGKNDRYALVTLNLRTGRTHQIRAHLSYIGIPIVGDAKYGDFLKNRIFERDFAYKFQFLFANKIKFSGMKGYFAKLNGLEVSSKLPDKELDILRRLNLTEKI
jgi:23S rRNA pseudouridine955/2504/2580 synthase